MENMANTANLSNVSLVFANASAEGSVAFAENKFAVDKSALVDQLNVSQNAITNSVYTLSADFDTLQTKRVDFDGAASGTVSVQAAASTSPHSLTLPSSEGGENTYLSNDGAGVLSWGAIPGTGTLIGLQTFTSAGVQTYTPTSGCKNVIVYAIGGGGGGGGAFAGGTRSTGGGGGEGGCRVGLFVVSDGVTGSVSVGAGGQGGGPSNPENHANLWGSLGSNTTFTYNGSTITGNGGRRGGNATSNNFSWTNMPLLSDSTSTAINGVLLSSYSVWGKNGFRADIYTEPQVIHGGSGNSSIFGGGGQSQGTLIYSGGNGIAGKDGVGGGGSGAYQSDGVAYNGGNGGCGGVYIYEYA